MYISYYKKEVVNSQKVSIYNEEDPYFWHHKGRQPEEKENLRYFAKILPEAIRKKENGEYLDENEQYSYDIFINNPPRLSYDPYEDIYTVSDGRHRMYMLREEGINIELEVMHYANFREKTLSEVFIENIQQKQEVIEEKFDKGSIFENFFDKILHINNMERISEKVESKYSNVIDIIAIIKNEINSKILSELGIDTLKSYDGFLIVDSKFTKLDELIKNFSNNDILVSTEKIRREER